MLRKRYAGFTQPLTQDDTIQGQVNECLVYMVNDLVRYHPGRATPLTFASSLLKGMINNHTMQRNGNEAPLINDGTR